VLRKAANDALAEAIASLPEQLRRSLTWDQGKEMAEHTRFSVATGVPVYLGDPTGRGSGAATRTPMGCCASTSPAGRRTGRRAAGGSVSRRSRPRCRPVAGVRGSSQGDQVTLDLCPNAGLEVSGRDQVSATSLPG
jgi:hypothetical protein